MTKKWISYAGITEKTGLSHSTIYRYWQSGYKGFPVPFQVSGTVVRWLESEIDDWTESLRAQRPQ